MKILTIIITMFTFSLSSMAQSISIKIDSIELVYLPRNLTAPISYTKSMLLSLSEENVKNKMIVDSTIIDSFSSSLDFSIDNLFYNSKKEIDVRLVIIIYLEGKKNMYISIDNNYKYEFLEHTHKPSWKLKAWIEEQIIW